MYGLGYDIGSPFIKASILDLDKGTAVAQASCPHTEMPILAVRPGWAEQDPDVWWKALQSATHELINRNSLDISRIKCVGITYQMHGLVLVNSSLTVLRPAVIWCDSRAVQIGNQAFEAIGKKRCLENYLNSPGNFTASKLFWVKKNEPELYKQAFKILLPGDYIAMKMTGNTNTTLSGLTEGIFWNFKKNTLASELFDYYGIDQELIPEVVPTFGAQGQITNKAAEELGLPFGLPVCYRAGDQPNNAFSLNVLEPGDAAANAGTSGVVFGVSDRLNYDPRSRVNLFAHVNHSAEQPRLGVLLCINGVGILYSWLKKYMAGRKVSYQAMDNAAAEAQIGSKGLIILPFGNGAERILENRNLGCRIIGLDFNRHDNSLVYRAAQEGIAFAFRYGMDIMQDMGVTTRVVRAGTANMFLSPVFNSALADATGSEIELFETDGALGAARGAAVGAGIYKSFSEAFAQLKLKKRIRPNPANRDIYEDIYRRWKKILDSS